MRKKEKKNTFIINHNEVEIVIHFIWEFNAKYYYMKISSLGLAALKYEKYEYSIIISQMMAFWNFHTYQGIFSSGGNSLSFDDHKI